MNKESIKLFTWACALAVMFACTLASKGIQGTAVPTQTLFPTQTLRVATQIISPTFTDTPLPTSTFTPEPTGPVYLPLLGRVWSGVRVYYGLLPEKAYGFEIVGGSDDCPTMPSGRGIKVKYPNGKEEWKDRMYLVSSGPYFVLGDDPALSKLDWRIYNDCP